MRCNSPHLAFGQNSAGGNPSLVTLPSSLAAPSFGSFDLGSAVASIATDYVSPVYGAGYSWLYHVNFNFYFGNVYWASNFVWDPHAIAFSGTPNYYSGNDSGYGNWWGPDYYGYSYYGISDLGGFGGDITVNPYVTSWYSDNQPGFNFADYGQQPYVPSGYSVDTSVNVKAAVRQEQSTVLSQSTLATFAEGALEALKDLTPTTITVATGVAEVAGAAGLAAVQLLGDNQLSAPSNNSTNPATPDDTATEAILDALQKQSLDELSSVKSNNVVPPESLTGHDMLDLMSEIDRLDGLKNSFDSPPLPNLTPQEVKAALQRGHDIEVAQKIKIVAAAYSGKVVTFKDLDNAAKDSKSGIRSFAGGMFLGVPTGFAFVQDLTLGGENYKLVWGVASRGDSPEVLATVVDIVQLPAGSETDAKATDRYFNHRRDGLYGAALITVIEAAQLAIAAGGVSKLAELKLPAIATAAPSAVRAVQVEGGAAEILVGDSGEVVVTGSKPAVLKFASKAEAEKTIAEMAGKELPLTESSSIKVTEEVADELRAAASFKGGSYSQVRAANVGGDVHHMPARSISPLSTEDGPSIWMETKDHVQTKSYGNSAAARAFRAQEQELISQGRMKDAIQMDIDDIRGLFGNKYNEGIAQMLAYAKRAGIIP